MERNCKKTKDKRKKIEVKSWKYLQERKKKKAQEARKDCRAKSMGSLREQESVQKKMTSG